MYIHPPPSNTTSFDTFSERCCLFPCNYRTGEARTYFFLPGVSCSFKPLYMRWCCVFVYMNSQAMSACVPFIQLNNSKTEPKDEEKKCRKDLYPLFSYVPILYCFFFPSQSISIDNLPVGYPTHTPTLKHTHIH